MTTLRWKVLVKPIIIIGLLIFSINFLISHAFEPTYKYQMSGIKKEQKKITKGFNEIFDNLDSDFKLGLISKEEYFIKLEKNKKDNSRAIKEFKQKRNFKRNEISYNGYNSKRMFKFWVGIGFFILLLSFRFAMKTTKSSSLFDKFEAIIYCSIAGFMFTWSVMNFQDYTKTTYLFWMIGLNIIVSVFAVLIITHYKTIDQKFRSAIKNLFDYIYDSEKDLKEETKNSHSIKRGKLIKDTIDNVG